MDVLLPALLAFPPNPPPSKPLSNAEYESQILALVKQLNSIPASQLLKPINGSENLLNLLDPAVNSLPYLYALLAHINHAKSQGNSDLDKVAWDGMQRFLTSFDPVQVRYAGAQWKSVVDEVLQLAQHATDPAAASRALQLAQRAMIRLDPGTSTLTTTHLELIQTCLRKRAYRDCLEILDNDIFHFPSDNPESIKLLPIPCATHTTSPGFITNASGFSNKLTHQNYLQYFLYGAMAYISQKAWSRAIALLELVLVCPVYGSTVSMIQVEAYKKWILVSLLKDGWVGSLPRNISQPMSKFLASLAKPYIVLADAFKEESPIRLRAEYKVAADHAVWQRDQNLGLVRMILAAHRRLQIQRFSKIYASIPLATLSELADSASSTHPIETATSVEAEIRYLISSQSIHAVIHPGKRGVEIVEFLSSAGETPRTAAELTRDMKRSISNVAALNVHVKDAQSRLELMREYIDATKLRRKPAKDGSDTALGLGDVPGTASMDEDMLAEY